jgi:hypothetical protein
LQLNDQIITDRFWLPGMGLGFEGKASIGLIPARRMDELLLRYNKYIKGAADHAARTVRQFRADCACLNVLIRRLSAALIIQSVWRGSVVRREWHGFGRKIRFLQTRIREWYAKRVAASNFIKKQWRLCLKRQARREQRMAVVIQSAVRGWLARGDVARRRFADAEFCVTARQLRSVREILGEEAEARETGLIVLRSGGKAMLVRKMRRRGEAVVAMDVPRDASLIPRLMEVGAVPRAVMLGAGARLTIQSTARMFAAKREFAGRIRRRLTEKKAARVVYGFLMYARVLARVHVIAGAARAFREFQGGSAVLYLTDDEMKNIHTRRVYQRVLFGFNNIRGVVVTNPNHVLAILFGKGRPCVTASSGILPLVKTDAFIGGITSGPIPPKWRGHVLQVRFSSAAEAARRITVLGFQVRDFGIFRSERKMAEEAAGRRIGNAVLGFIGRADERLWGRVRWKVLIAKFRAREKPRMPVQTASEGEVRIVIRARSPVEAIAELRCNNWAPVRVSRPKTELARPKAVVEAEEEDVDEGLAIITPGGVSPRQMTVPKRKRRAMTRLAVEPVTRARQVVDLEVETQGIFDSTATREARGFEPTRRKASPSQVQSSVSAKPQAQQRREGSPKTPQSPHEAEESKPEDWSGAAEPDGAAHASTARARATSSQMHRGEDPRAATFAKLVALKKLELALAIPHEQLTVLREAVTELRAEEDEALHARERATLEAIEAARSRSRIESGKVELARADLHDRADQLRRAHSRATREVHEASREEFADNVAFNRAFMSAVGRTARMQNQRKLEAAVAAERQKQAEIRAGLEKEAKRRTANIERLHETRQVNAQWTRTLLQERLANAEGWAEAKRDRTHSTRVELEAAKAGARGFRKEPIPELRPVLPRMHVAGAAAVVLADIIGTELGEIEAALLSEIIADIVS